MLRMLSAVQTVGGLTASHNRRQVLREHVQRIAELAARTIESPHDRERVQRRLTTVRDVLESTP